MPFFRYRLRHLGQLCQQISEPTKTGLNAMDPRGWPAFILSVLTLGYLVAFNLHIHALVGAGVFSPCG